MRRDLMTVAGVTLLMTIASMRFDFSEKLLAWTSRGERFQLDELPAIALTLALCLIWFAWRRYREAGLELAKRRAAEERLAGALSENRQLARQNVRVQESERKAMARELHDELGQYLNAIKIDAVSLRSCTSADPSRIHAALSAIIQNTDHVHSVVGDMIRRLRPVGLDDLGLVAALEHCVNGWRQRLPQIEFSLSVDGPLDDLGESLNVTLYRLLQEGLTNVSKHAHARRVDISVLVASVPGDPRGEVVFTMRDDGVGTNLAERTDGLGLIGMRERVETLGGRLRIESAPGRGFAVHARVPPGATG